MKVVNKKVGELIPYKNNQKIHTDEQVERIADSILEFGMIQPLVIDKEGTIVIGHGRYEACALLNHKTVPCVVVDDLSEKQIKTLRIADNRLNESEWNVELLKNEIMGDLVDIELLGFTNDEIDDLLSDNSIFDESEDEDELLEDDKEIPKMERRLNEHNDYIVYVFRNSMDFSRIVHELKLRKVDSSLTPKTKNIGVGRVLDGKKLLELIDATKNNSK